ncbi:hypothetical protein MCOR21_007076 [Pyricularia oryzae]|nr:hypothetical protein MCOR21_007076 [Pyricularia oryzae]
MFSNENHSPVADKLPKTQDLDSDVIDWGLDFTRAAAIVKMQPTFTLYILTSLVICHSWVEQVMRIALNGTIVGPVGYMRGYFGRNDPGFVDRANTYLLPPNGRSKGVILNSDGICSPSQKIGNYSPKYPMLSAAPGDFIALRYQENGHVSLPGNGPLKPENRGTIYVYGTSEPDDNHKLLDIYRKWTAGRDKGRLIATRPFNDGQCYQINNGDISVKRQNHVPLSAFIYDPFVGRGRHPTLVKKLMRVFRRTGCRPHLSENHVQGLVDAKTLSYINSKLQISGEDLLATINTSGSYPSIMLERRIFCMDGQQRTAAAEKMFGLEYRWTVRLYFATRGSPQNPNPAFSLSYGADECCRQACGK